MLKTNTVLSTGDVARSLYVSGQTVNRYVKDGLLRPMRQSRGTGNHNVFSPADVRTLGLLLELVRRGVDRQAAATVAEYLRLADVAPAFAEGKTLMVACGSRVSLRPISLEDLIAVLEELAREDSAGAHPWEQVKIIHLADAVGEVDLMLATVNASEAERTADNCTEATATT